jgi:hypothetical protein
MPTNARKFVLGKASAHLLLALGLALLAGCSASPSSSSNTGSAQFVVSARQALSAEISRITVTSSAADMDTISVDLAASDGVWGGTIGSIPPGWTRTFHAQAFDASNHLRYEGTASNVSIWAGQVALVAINLQEANVSPFSNEAPFVDSLVASSIAVSAGGTLTLEATAHDPNPSDSIGYTWSSKDGHFSSAHASATSWVAPPTGGTYALTLKVTDSTGLSSSLSLLVTVAEGEGGQGEVRPSLSFNSWPRVSSVKATPSPVAVGQKTSVSASSSDADGDALSYSWSATCAGSWENATSRTPRFTPTAQPSGTCNNCSLTVSVSDGKGGQATGTVALCVGGIAPTANEPSPPYIARSYSSSDTASASQVLTYEVVARDLQGSPLSFSWSSDVGSLGSATHGELSSRITWTAPVCVAEGATATITATVTNGLNLTATRSFVVTEMPACAYAWNLTSAMAEARYSHTATALPNGQVLVSGGYGYYYYYSGPLASTELYDSATGTWSATGSMASARYQHTATLLSDGKVLVVGGYNDYGPVATAELYDPATGTWSAAGSMASARYHHTATLLSDGKVIVAGGYNYNGPQATAELYDPATGTWSATGSMASARYQHTATLLLNGQVLVVAGGSGYYDSLATAEVYEPATGTWSATGSLASARYQHTATLLLNGQVLVAGGSGYYDSLATAEVYEPATGTWSATGSMASARYQHTATLLPSGKVLVSGGTLGGWYSTNVAKAALYDPATGTWSGAGTMKSPRRTHTATLLPDGHVLAAGGYSDVDGYVSAAELYTP